MAALPNDPVVLAIPVRALPGTIEFPGSYRKKIGKL
jgi:hypothetical protein